MKPVPRPLLLVGLCAACGNGSTSETSGPAAASVIPHAAVDAQGADYPPPGAAKAGGASTGIPECDEYFDKVHNCTALPPSAKPSMEEAEKRMREAIALATTPEARQAIAKACKQAAEAFPMCKQPRGSRELGF